MKITHPGLKLIFYFYVFFEFVLHIFHCSFHIFELMLFHVFIYFICLIRILFIMFNNCHFRFVYFCYFVVCMCLHEYVQIIVMWILSFVVVYAGNRMDVTGGKCMPKSASSILQALSCRFVGCNCVIEVNSWSPKVNPPSQESRGVHLNGCNSPTRSFAIINRNALRCNKQSWRKLFSSRLIFSSNFIIIPPPGLASIFLDDRNFSKGAYLSNNFGSTTYAKSSLQSRLKFTSSRAWFPKNGNQGSLYLYTMLGGFFQMVRNLPLWPTGKIVGKTCPFRKIPVGRKGRGQKKIPVGRKGRGQVLWKIVWKGRERTT